MTEDGSRRFGCDDRNNLMNGKKALSAAGGALFCRPHTYAPRSIFALLRPFFAENPLVCAAAHLRGGANRGDFREGLAG